VKDAKYRHQSEVRLVIGNLDPSVEERDMHFLDVPELPSTCRIVQPSPIGASGSNRTFTAP
jgi:hypothetical protein